MIIYKHTNLVNGKYYIGKTKYSIEQRWNEHYNAACRNSKYAFHRAIQKYGKYVWKHEILETVSTNLEANKQEIFWIAYFDATKKGYNLTFGGEGGRMPDEINKKLSEIGKLWIRTSEYRQSCREGQQIYWKEHPDDPRRRRLAERNSTDEMRQISKDAQIRRWERWFKEHPKQPKHIITDEERKQRKIKTSEKMSAAKRGRKRGKYKKSDANRGKNNPQARKVAVYDLNQQIVDIYDTIGDAAKKYSINRTKISTACKTQLPYNGLIWKFID